MGEEYIEHNVATICNMFIKEQTLAKLNSKEELEVNIFGHQHAAVLVEMYSNLKRKAARQGPRPRGELAGATGYPAAVCF